MKTFIVFIFLLLFPISSFSLELDAINFYPNVYESLKKREVGWFIHGGSAIFANPEDIPKLKKMSYPEHDMRSIVVLDYNLFHNGGYVSVEKPMDEFVPDPHEERILNEIKSMVMDKLYDEGIRRTKNTVIMTEKVTEEVKQPKKSSFKKIEAKGRKL